MANSVSLKLHKSAISSITRKFENCTLSLAWAIARQGSNYAPVASGDLSASVRAEKRSNNEIVAVAGGSSVGVPYALRREYENNLHPDKKHYMKRAKNTVMSGDWVSQYYGGGKVV